MSGDPLQLQVLETRLSAMEAHVTDLTSIVGNWQEHPDRAGSMSDSVSPNPLFDIYRQPLVSSQQSSHNHPT